MTDGRPILPCRMEDLVAIHDLSMITHRSEVRHIGVCIWWQKLTHLWSVSGSKRIRHRRTARFRMVVAWRSYAFACFAPGKLQHQSDSTWWTASIATHCECGQTSSPRAPVAHLTGTDLLEAREKNEQRVRYRDSEWLSLFAESDVRSCIVGFVIQLASD